MSVDRFAEAWRVSGLDPASKLTLLALADCVNHADVDRAWPSVAALTEKTGV